MDALLRTCLGTLALLASPLAPGPEDPLEELRAAIGDDSPGTRRRAVNKIAAVGGAEAWELVIGALADPEPEVADEAQLALGSLGDQKALAELLGRGGLTSREAGVPPRAAEALGRVDLAVDGSALTKRISTRDVELTSALLWSVERLALGGRLAGDRGVVGRALQRVLKSRRSPRLRGDALIALACLPHPDLERLALDAVGSREPVLRCAALVAARLGDLEGEANWARALVNDEHPLVRLQAIESLGRSGTPDAVLALVERLESEPRLALRWSALAALQRLSGMGYRFDPRPWRLWVEEGMQVRAAPAREERRDAGATRAGGLVGLPLHSDRVCFLFDFSGSMWSKLPDGRTPKEIVDGELRTALEHLPEETLFNVVPFTYDPIPWEPEVVPATKRNVRSALDFFERCRAVGKGNFYDAALLALADPEVDTIVVLTDGVPTGGTHCDMDLILPLFLHANRFRKVTVDSILVDAPAGARRRWAELSRQTGGRSIEVELGEKP